MEPDVSSKNRVFFLFENRSNTIEDIETAVSKQWLCEAEAPTLRQLEQSGSRKVDHCCRRAPGFRFRPKQLLVWGARDTPLQTSPRNRAGVVGPSSYYISVRLRIILVLWVTETSTANHVSWERISFSAG